MIGLSPFTTKLLSLIILLGGRGIAIGGILLALHLFSLICFQVFLNVLEIVGYLVVVSRKNIKDY